MKATFITFFLSALYTFAGPDNEFIEELHILPKLIEAADRSGSPLHTEVRRNNVGEKYHWYLSTAHFIGQFDASFGRVYVTQFVFTESRERNSQFHAHHYGYVCFFDAKFHLRHHWRLDQLSSLLYASHSAIMLGDNAILDFNDLPASGKTNFDAHQEDVPKW